MEGLIHHVTRQEFNRSAPVLGQAVQYIGQGVLGNEQVQLDGHYLVKSITSSALELIDSAGRNYFLVTHHVEEAEVFKPLA